MAALIPTRYGLAALAVLLAAGTAGAGIVTFTQNQSDSSRVALGYPVPMPVSSQTPVDGFRRYDSLMARLQDLALLSDSLIASPLGRTAAGRDIVGLRLGDADTVTPEGFPESAVLQNGTIHAREWASPEVVAGIAERYIANENDQGLYRWLLDTTQLLLIPVLNVDGFLQTQRYPDTALFSEFVCNANGQPRGCDDVSFPRDGRMRRKNMRGADEILCAADDPACAVADGMQGVDNNRNNPPFWASSNRSSGDSRSLVFHGSAPGSEPEIQALRAAAELGPAPRLRLYIDTHSFSRVYFAADTGNARRNAIQRTLAGVMSATSGSRYGYDPTAANVGIGTTDEYFANTYQIPAYTLEIEPSPNGATDYGGRGYHHDGFVLPENQIARVRRELADATVIGNYRMAGPPVTQALDVRERSSGTVVFAARWQRSDDSSRRLVVSTRSALRTDTAYRLWLAFDRPMRVRDASGAVAQFPGRSVPLAPRLTLEGIAADGSAFNINLPATAADWRRTGSGAPEGFQQYRDDALALDFTLPASTPLTGARRLALAVDAQDLSGAPLDANPATAADWQNGAWTRYENSSGTAGDDGGVDRAFRLVDDGAPLFGPAPAAPAAAGGSGGGGLLGSPVWLLAALLFRRKRMARGHSHTSGRLPCLKK